MTSRNRAFLRSILFGVMTKGSGALIVFVGLPIIAHALPVTDYADFLTSMTAASVLTLVFGASGTLAIRNLAHALAANDPALLQNTENESAGLFLAAFAVAGLVAFASLGAAFTHHDLTGPLLAVTAMALVQGLVMWGDAYRVASRTDYKSSIWQLVGSATMLVLLIALARHGLWMVVVIYFGCPLAVQIGILVQLWRERRLQVRPTLHPAAVLTQLRGVAPIIVNSLADYVKIFGSGLIVGKLTNDAEYARYVTIVLLMARLVNPISLITRPLMPAYLDAVHDRDRRWLRAVGLIVSVGAVTSLIAVILVSLAIPPSFLTWALPPSLSTVSRYETVFSLCFLWGYAFTALIYPFFVAAAKTTLFSVVNAILVLLGIGAGALFTPMIGSDGMLFSMSASVVLTAVGVTTYAVAKLLTLPPQDAVTP